MVGQREGRKQAQSVANLLELFIGPLEEWLDDQLDRRLVRTFFLALAAMVRLRHNRSGLLLSELGGHILSPDKAPAGTKRLSNLLRSPKWSHTLLERFLWYRADAAVDELQAAGETPLALWDESVLEKSESLALEGLGPVRSSKAARLKRIKPGYYNPPGGPPVFVPGLQWITIMVAGYSGPSTLAAMRWWTRRGPLATDRFTNLISLLDHCAEKWGQGVIHVWDRGFAGEPWLKELTSRRLRFVMRWHTNYHLTDDKGSRNAWKIARGKRSVDHRMLWDIHRCQYRKTGIVYLPVRHPQVDQPLWLVVSRPGQGRKPWYLLTNEPITTVADAWSVVFAYARRWQVELCYRACKTDLAMESPRLWFLGKPAQAVAHGQPALLIPALPAGPMLPASAPRPVTKLVPQNRKAVPRRRDTASPNQVSFVCPLACLSPQLLHLYRNFGMTHACAFRPFQYLVSSFCYRFRYFAIPCPTDSQ